LGCDKPNSRQARTPYDGLREWSLWRWIPHPSDRTRVLAFSALWSYTAVQKGVDVAKAVEGESEPISGRLGLGRLGPVSLNPRPGSNFRANSMNVQPSSLTGQSRF
jgi:hypothetical protein